MKRTAAWRAMGSTRCGAPGPGPEPAPSPLRRYAAVGAIVAAALIAAALIVVADIRARVSTNIANMRAAQPHPNVKFVEAKQGGDTLEIDSIHDVFVIDASKGDIHIKLPPEASAFENRWLTFERLDGTAHEVVLDAVDGFGPVEIKPPKCERRVFVQHGHWKPLEN